MITAQVFAGQTGVRLTIKTLIDFDEDPISTAKIKFIKPDDTTGEWTATILPDSTDGSIYFDFTNDAGKCFDQKGWWKLWVEGTYADNRTFEGKRVKYFVDD